MHTDAQTHTETQCCTGIHTHMDSTFTDSPTYTFSISHTHIHTYMGAHTLWYEHSSMFTPHFTAYTSCCV